MSVGGHCFGGGSFCLSVPPTSVLPFGVTSLWRVLVWGAPPSCAQPGGPAGQRTPRQVALTGRGQLWEAQAISTSLSTLALVIMAFSNKAHTGRGQNPPINQPPPLPQESHVPPSWGQSPGLRQELWIAWASSHLTLASVCSPGRGRSESNPGGWQQCHGGDFPPPPAEPRH